MVSLYIFSVKLYNLAEYQKNATNVLKKNHSVSLDTTNLRLADNKMNTSVDAMVKKVRSLEKNMHQKDNFINRMNYKLLYVYGSESLKHFGILFLQSVVFFGFIVYFINFGIVFSIFIVFLLGFWGAVILTNRVFDKKIAQFLDNFVYAIDAIVRGIRNGLALNACFKQITQDANPVVAEQFVVLLDDFKMGLTAEQAFDRFRERLPIKDVTFFCLSVLIQGKTGGNLAEILSSLSRTLRNRKSLLVKIKTLSSEAKTSAIIMGAMPVFVLGILALIAFDYIGILFETQMGNYVLFGCGIWMAIGGLIMRQMINFYK
jgi:tight adherence protein B